MNICQIIDFIKSLNLKNFNEPSRQERRNKKNVGNIDKSLIPRLQIFKI